jgi:SAM-dependent methyltransferase
MASDHDITADPSNAGQLDAWDGDQGAYWADNADRFDASLAAAHDHFLPAAAIGPSHRVLDVGCGNGQSTRAAARIASGGSVLGVDVSARMLAVARAAAVAEGLENIEFSQADAQIHPFDHGEFDAVISRMGAMFFGDPIAAFTNMQRALRPDGTLTLLTWQALNENEWITELRAALAAGRDLPTPPPHVPSPFALSDAERVEAILDAAGFADVALVNLREPMYFGTDADEAYKFALGLQGWLLDGLDDAARDDALVKLRASLAGHTGDDGTVAYDAAMWIITARKP